MLGVLGTAADWRVMRFVGAWAVDQSLQTRFLFSFPGRGPLTHYCADRKMSMIVLDWDRSGGN